MPDFRLSLSVDLGVSVYLLDSAYFVEVVVVVGFALVGVLVVSDMIFLVS